MRGCLLAARPPQCHFGVPRLPGDCSLGSPLTHRRRSWCSHRPSRGCPSSVGMSHSCHSHHTRTGRWSKGIRVSGSRTSRELDGRGAGKREGTPGRKVRVQGRGKTGSGQRLQEAGKGDRPRRGRAGAGARRPGRGRRDRPGGGKIGKVHTGEGDLGQKMRAEGERDGKGRKARAGREGTEPAQGRAGAGAGRPGLRWRGRDSQCRGRGERPGTGCNA